MIVLREYNGNREERREWLLTVVGILHMNIWGLQVAKVRRDV